MLINITFNIWQIIIYFGVINTIILSIILFFKKQNKKASFWIALLLLLISVNYLDMEGASYLYRNVSWYTIDRIIQQQEISAIQRFPLT